MSFIMVWLIASFIVFYTRFGVGIVLDVSFFLGVAFTGLLWALGIGIALIVFWFIIVVLCAAMGEWGK